MTMIAEIQKDKHRKAEDYVDECYSREIYLNVYAHIIHLVLGNKPWVDTKHLAINQSTVRKQPGRPKNCKEKGHNSRKCTHAIHPNSKFYKDPSAANRARSVDRAVVDRAVPY
ncbi:hypothetical protein ACH5RR_039186 [Cinchona calisaya]|uniref:Uncharacterized protein n=1 Tax=Cinchona calisaya TaxID=153742 RepID=A0ABD2XYX2_9GENT